MLSKLSFTCLHYLWVFMRLQIEKLPVGLIAQLTEISAIQILLFEKHFYSQFLIMSFID